ncbi:MAG: hypothetical protein CME06_12600, partial [Gemmatimonadetes bacterium]|nr:hypothetical protein [Gemmatimonadota bacterium]
MGSPKSVRLSRREPLRRPGTQMKKTPTLPLADLSQRAARRLALAKAGLLKPEWADLPKRAAGGGVRARKAALRIIDHFGYLQLDTVAIAGARSHAIVLLSRLEGFDPTLAEA